MNIILILQFIMCVQIFVSVIILWSRKSCTTLRMVSGILGITYYLLSKCIQLNIYYLFIYIRIFYLGPRAWKKAVIISILKSGKDPTITDQLLYSPSYQQFTNESSSLASLGITRLSILVVRLPIDNLDDLML